MAPADQHAVALLAEQPLLSQIPEDPDTDDMVYSLSMILAFCLLFLLYVPLSFVCDMPWTVLISVLCCFYFIEFTLPFAPEISKPRSVREP
ncbi:hypothetical protein ACFL59_16570 [Planctomycetota bacterium]